MAEPRKIFRIEQTPLAHLPRGGNGMQPSMRPARDADGMKPSAHHAEMMQALAALTAAVGTPNPGPKNTNGGGKHDHGQWAVQAEHLTRIAQELEAVTAGTAQATQKILGAAEEIDQLANNLSAALKGKIQQGLAQDISDLVIRIFEACNFQDLIGQRVSKVMKTLDGIEDHIQVVLDGSKTLPVSPPSTAAHFLHGPRLDSDSGHITQSEIDALFGG